MDMKKISAACATAAALAALCVPGAAFAADGTLTLNAGDGSTLAGHSFTVYKVAGYNDVVKDGANVKSVSASSPDATTDAWVKAALNKNGVTYNTSEGRNAAEQLLRLKTNSDTLRKVAGTLQSTAASSKVAAVKTNQTSATGSLNLTLPEGYYLVVDAQGIPILVSTTIGGSVRMSNGQTLGSTQIKTNVTKIDKKIKSVDGTWKDSAAATNGETRDFKATFTVPNKLAVDTITLEDHMTGIVYVDGSFHATTSSGTDVTNQFGTIGKDKVAAAAGNTQTDGTGFKVTSLQSLVDTYQGKQVTVTYQGKVVNASKANKAINQIILTSNWLPSVIPPDMPTPNPGTDETPVPTYDVNLKKISAADGNKVIQGAKFKLHNDSLNQWYVWNTSSNQWTFTTDESKATEFSTNASGVINFTRLGADRLLQLRQAELHPQDHRRRPRDHHRQGPAGTDRQGHQRGRQDHHPDRRGEEHRQHHPAAADRRDHHGRHAGRRVRDHPRGHRVRLRRLPSPSREPGRRSGHRLIFPNRPRPRKRRSGDPGAGIVRPFLLSAARSRPSSKKYGTHI